MTDHVQRYADEFGASWAECLERYVPPSMQGGVVRYVLDGVKPGDFLCALFRNDFMDMARRADDNNQRLFMDYARFLYNAAPQGSYGSAENFKTWLGHKGMKMEHPDE